MKIGIISQRVSRISLRLWICTPLPNGTIPIFGSGSGITVQSEFMVQSPRDGRNNAEARSGQARTSAWGGTLREWLKQRMGMRYGCGRTHEIRLE